MHHVLHAVCNTSPTGTRCSLQPPLSRTFVPFVRNAFILFVTNWPLMFQAGFNAPVSQTCQACSCQRHMHWRTLPSIGKPFPRSLQGCLLIIQVPRQAEDLGFLSSSSPWSRPTTHCCAACHAFYLMVGSVFISTFTCLFAC